MNSSVHPTRRGALLHAAATLTRWFEDLLREWRVARRRVAERRAFESLDAANLRDLGMSRGEYDSFLAEAQGLARPTRRRAARPLQPDAWL